MKAPLNGVKTHPLSDHARGVLKRMVGGAIEAYTVNPGVRNRLDREDLISYYIRTDGRQMIRLTLAGMNEAYHD